MDDAELRERAEEFSGRKFPRLRRVLDTSDFMAVGPGDVLTLDEHCILILGNTYEGRFGLDDEPKHWVKRALDLGDGSPKIVKLVFYEEFDLPIGSIKVRCFRSPLKEARILELVREHRLFMHGVSVDDQAGNNVRILERIRGHPLDQDIRALPGDHQEYFAKHLKRVLGRLLELFEAIGFLHQHGERHGDVRRDHIFVDADNGDWRWIDFDYNFEFRENPFGLDLFGLGNVLLYAVAKGVPTAHSLKREQPELLGRLTEDDFSPVIRNRLVNLRQLYPYIPRDLNRVLLHFSAGAPVYYESVAELLADLTPAWAQLPGDAEE
ncbi:MAG: serine/threonine protein kinase [Deltaproteobacteria bacterium]|nr:serine/threonine protein kinase [Deltaproteobacteria bacterium]